MPSVTTLLGSKYAVHIAELGATTGILVAMLWETDRELAITIGVLAGVLALSGTLSTLPGVHAGLETRVNAAPALFLLPMALTASIFIGGAKALRHWLVEYAPAVLERLMRDMRPGENRS